MKIYTLVLLIQEHEHLIPITVTSGSLTRHADLRSEHAWLWNRRPNSSAESSRIYDLVILSSYDFSQVYRGLLLWEQVSRRLLVTVTSVFYSYINLSRHQELKVIDRQLKAFTARPYNLFFTVLIT